MSQSLYDHGVLDIWQTCPFCQQFGRAGGVGLYHRVAGVHANRTIYEDDEFVVVPTLGQIVKGWLLIIPRQHVMALAGLPGQNQHSFLSLVARVRQAVSKHFGQPFLFEHGSVDGSARSGACVEHAHLHVVPWSTDIAPEAARWLDLHNLPGGLSSLLANPPLSSYVFYERVDRAAYLAQPNSPVPCQLVRRLVATAIGYPESWDWRTELTIDRVNEVANTLRNTV